MPFTSTWTPSILVWSGRLLAAVRSIEVELIAKHRDDVALGQRLSTREGSIVYDASGRCDGRPLSRNREFHRDHQVAVHAIARDGNGTGINVGRKPGGIGGDR